MTCFAGLNVRKFVAGGNHSMFMIDEFSPFPYNYKWPELLKSQKDRALSKSAKSVAGVNKDIISVSGKSA